MRRTKLQEVKDTISFPLRAFTLFFEDKYGFSALATERFDYVAREVKGYCLDVGCGRNNVFVKNFLKGKGVGIDVFPYEGLTPDQIVPDLSHFPFEDATFDSVTFIANLNHVPEPMRDVELAEAYRCLKPGGNIIVTMGNPLAELAVHKVVWAYDRFLGANIDVDTERGMHEDEDYYLTDIEIVERLARAGFSAINKKSFVSQWNLNHLLVGWKK